VRVGGRPSIRIIRELAIPLFDQLCNFAHWRTQNREEAKGLVQETYAEALRGVSSFQLGTTNSRARMYRIFAQYPSDLAHWIESNHDRASGS
jgi:DNA-directed RNA polymerase specialized sigma24 family protein